MEYQGIRECLYVCESTSKLIKGYRNGSRTVARFREGKGRKPVKWINNYHKGFNRVWLVISAIGVCLCVFYLENEGVYWDLSRSWRHDRTNEVITEVYANLSESEKHNFDTYRYELRSHVEAKLYDRMKEKIWEYRILSLFGGYIIVFVIGHGCFCLVVWMIRGFIKQ